MVPTRGGRHFPIGTKGQRADAAGVSHRSRYLLAGGSVPRVKSGVAGRDQSLAIGRKDGAADPRYFAAGLPKFFA